MQDRFRFRYSYNNHVYNVLGIDFDFSRAVLHSLIGSETLMCKINLDNLMPCTGKRDRNGILIYEGDIVQTTFENNSKIIFSVVWDDKTALFNGKIIKREGINNYFMPNRDYLYYLLGDKEDEVEVIGNIYENPELLKD